MTKESYESGIGPGCVYRHKQTFIGINVQRFEMTEEEWVQNVVQTAGAVIPDARTKKVRRIGDAAFWIESSGPNVLHVWADGTAFDLYLSLSEKNDPQKLLRVASPLAVEVLEGLAAYEPSPTARPVAT